MESIIDSDNKIIKDPIKMEKEITEYYEKLFEKEEET